MTTEMQVSVERGSPASLDRVAWVIPRRLLSSVRFEARCLESDLSELANGQYINNFLNTLPRRCILEPWKEAP